MGIIQKMFFGTENERTKKIAEQLQMLEKYKDKLFLHLSNKTIHIYDVTIEYEDAFWESYNELSKKLESENNKLFSNQSAEIEAAMLESVEKINSIYNDAINFLKE